MKIRLLNILAILVVMGLVLPRVGTIATWSDSETSEENYIETGSLDLKVRDQDDQPWGAGVGAMFDIPDGHTCTSYEQTASLFNAGDANGVAYLEIKNLADPDNLSLVMDTEIWYDGSLVTSDRMSNLAGYEIELGNLLSSETKMVTIVLHPIGGDTGDSLTFDIQFDLTTGGTCPWSDSEVSEANSFTHHCGQSGTIGFWGNWDSHNTYTRSEIEGWLAIIDSASGWLGPTTTEGMKQMIQDAQGSDSYLQSLGHYLMQRLNQISGRQDSATLHNVTALDPTNYLGLTNPSATSGAEIVSAIEAKYGTSPTATEFETIKNVCDALNNLWI
jgi:predicted ribosomally synthesized peptide with SipW-like signal peptide